MSIVQESPQTTRDWFWTIPLISSTYDTVTSVYEGTRDRNALTRFTIGTVESSVKLAGRCASPLVNKLESKFEKPLTAADGYALRKLQEVEATYPVIMKPTDEVIAQSKEALMGTLERSSQRVADYQAVKLIGSGVSAGSSVVGSTIKLGQQGINCTINTGCRSINAANHLVGMGVDRCLDVTEAVVTYMLPEHEDKDSLDEPLLLSNPTDSAKKERRRRRQQRCQRRELRKARRSHLLKASKNTWAGRLDRVQDLVTTTVDRSGDKVYDYLEWPMEQVELLRTLRVARAAATAYEVILEYLEDARERIMAFNPLKVKQKKLNLLTDNDEDESSVGVIESLKIKTVSFLIEYVDLPIYLAISIYQVTAGTSAGLVELGITKITQLYNEGQRIPIINTVLTKATDLKDVILKMLGIVESGKAHTVSSKTMTVTISTHDDTPVIEDVHHSDKSETSSDEGSSSSDENEDDK